MTKLRSCIYHAKENLKVVVCEMKGGEA